VTSTPGKGPSRLIAIDADGVLLDYTGAYARRWEQCFGVRPQLKDPNAYWPRDIWGVEHLTGERLEYFRHFRGEEFWESFDAMPGALQACQMLAKAGWELVCVTALTPRYESARLRNLRRLGFPIEVVHATGHPDDHSNPKKPLIDQLRPAAFVDDFLPYLQGIAAPTFTALIEPGRNKSPNADPMLKPAMGTYPDLLAFASAWVAGKALASSRN